MKIFFHIVFFSILIGVNFSFSEEKLAFQSFINVGNSPLKTLKFDGKYYAVCAGADFDFDSRVDEGEELPSIWEISEQNGVFSSKKVFEFNHFLIFPLRIAVDTISKTIYIPTCDGIYAFYYENGSYHFDQISSIKANGLDVIAGHLLISHNDSNNNGLLTVYNLANSAVLQTLKIGINLQETIYYKSNQGISIACLTIGPYNKDESKLYFGAINHMFDFSLSDSIVLGNTGNHLYFNNDKLYVTVNMSHLIKEIDVNTKEVRTFYTGTTSFNGPRESTVHNNKLYVTTYSEDIRVFDLYTGALTRIEQSNINLHKESIDFYNDKYCLATCPYTSTYEYKNIIELYKVHNDTVVYNDYKVGKQPIFTKYIDNTLHIFCKGSNENEDDVLDLNDEKPSWWTINNNFVQKIMDFELNSFDEMTNFVVDTNNEILYIPNKEQIIAYNYNNFNFIKNINHYKPKDIDFAGPHLIIAVNKPNESDSIVIYNAQSDITLQQIYAGDSVKNVRFFMDADKLSLAFTTYINAENKWYLMYGPIVHFSEFEMQNKIEIDYPDQMIIDDNSIILNFKDKGTFGVINISNNKFDLKSSLLYNPDFKINYIASDSSNVFLATDNYDFRFYNKQETEISEIFPANLKVTYISKINIDNKNIIIFSSKYQKNGSLNDRIYTTDRILTSVGNNAPNETELIKLYPNPSKDYVVIKSSNHIFTILQIYNMQGELIKSIDNLNHNMIKIDDLSTGFYILKLIDLKGNTYNTKLNVIR